MVKLEVTAPGKRRVDLDCELSTTVREVKEFISQALAVPPDKQRLLLNKKERKFGAETLAAAGVTGDCKAMLMLVPGYAMPEPLAMAGELLAEAVARTELQSVAPIEASSVLQLPQGTSLAEVPGLVHVTQGRNRYHVAVPQGLAAATFGELAEHLTTAVLPKGLPASELRFLHRGKNPSPGESLGSDGLCEIKVMLLFKEGFYAAADGAHWLKEQGRELGEAEEELSKLGRRIESNLTDSETSLKLLQLGDVVAVLRQSLDSVRIAEASLPDYKDFRSRVEAASEKVDALRRALKL